MTHATNERPLTEFEKLYREEIERRNREVTSCLRGIRTACMLLDALPDFRSDRKASHLARDLGRVLCHFFIENGTMTRPQMVETEGAFFFWKDASELAYLPCEIMCREPREESPHKAAERSDVSQAEIEDASESEGRVIDRESGGDWEFLLAPRWLLRSHPLNSGHSFAKFSAVIEDDLPRIGQVEWSTTPNLSYSSRAVLVTSSAGDRGPRGDGPAIVQ